LVWLNKLKLLPQFNFEFFIFQISFQGVCFRILI
jgi:hypothetical protein